MKFEVLNLTASEIEKYNNIPDFPINVITSMNFFEPTQKHYLYTSFIREGAPCTCMVEIDTSKQIYKADVEMSIFTNKGHLGFTPYGDVSPIEFKYDKEDNLRYYFQDIVNIAIKNYLIMGDSILGTLSDLKELYTV